MSTVGEGGGSVVTSSSSLPILPQSASKVGPLGSFLLTPLNCSGTSSARAVETHPSISSPPFCLFSGPGR